MYIINIFHRGVVTPRIVCHTLGIHICLVLKTRLLDYNLNCDHELQKLQKLQKESIVLKVLNCKKKVLTAVPLGSVDVVTK